MKILGHSKDSWKVVRNDLDADRDVVTVSPVDRGIDRVNSMVSRYDGPPAFILWSTGTTGEPRGIAVPWPAVRVRCQQIVDNLGITQDSVIFTGGMMYHNFGMISGALAAERGGAQLIVPDKAFNWNALRDALQSTTITHAFLLTNQAKGLAKREMFRGLSIGNIYLGGEQLSEELRATVVEQSGATVFDSFGSSETGTVAKSDGGPTDGWLTPYDGVETTTQDNLIAWKTPGLAWGVLDEAPLTVDELGFWLSADLGQSDQGRIKVTGRHLWRPR